MLYYRYHGKILTILPIWVCLRDPCATPNQFAPQTLSQSLAIQGFGRAGSLFTFPRKGTETALRASLRASSIAIIIYISP